MKEYHVNLGRIFSAPCESEYSILRRCLIANAGVPLTRIRHSLAVQREQLNLSTVECLKAFQQITTRPLVNKNRSYQRQCPQCAAAVYHTDLFSLPWLKRCPIHACELTTECPACKLPWPKESELHKRPCSLCGMFKIDAKLQQALSTRENLSFGPFVALMDLCTHQYRHAANLSQDKVSQQFYPWWCEPDYGSEDFPLFAAQPTWPKYTALLESVGAAVWPMRKIVTPLSPLEHANGFFVQHRFVDSPAHSEASLARMSYLHAEYRVFKELIRWISHPSRHPSQLHLADYEGWRCQHIMDGPLPCPYCMAISLWLYQTLTHLYERSELDWLKLFTFIQELGALEIADVISAPIVVSSALEAKGFIQQYFKPDPAFSLWFYRRSLMIKFLQILHFTQHIYSRYRTHQVSDGCEYLERYFLGDKIQSDQFIMTYMKGNSLTVYYLNEVPLLSSSVAPFHMPTNHCRTFHRHHFFDWGRPRSFLYLFDAGSEICWQEFQDLREHFGDHLRALFDNPWLKA